MSHADVLEGERRDHVLTLVAVGAGIAVSVIGPLLELPGLATATAAGATAAIPAIVGLARSRTGRDRTADLARLRRGELRRPVSLVVVLLAAAILAVDSVLGVLVVTVVWSTGWEPVTWIGILLLAVASLLMTVYASHYLGPRPYTMAALAFLVMLAARILIISLTLTTLGAEESIPSYLVNLVNYLLVLGAMMLGVYIGRRRYDEFVAEKARRLALQLDEEADGRAARGGGDHATQTAAGDRTHAVPEPALGPPAPTSAANAPLTGVGTAASTRSDA